jgi:tRNA G18 (ribose-2'-O)-methylase SpoU
VPVHLITDPDDDRLGDYRALTDLELRTKWEQPFGLFIAEGELVLRRALRAGYRPRSYLVDAKRVEQLDDLAGDTPVYAATPHVLERITGFRVHRGVLASFHRLPLLNADDVVAAARRVAILEDVNNHTNIGAVFRGAAALGVDAVLLSPTCADPLYRRSVRVSLGHVLRVPFARLPALPGGLEVVRSAGLEVVALTPAPDAPPLRDLPQDGRPRALVVGAEGPGLTAATLAAVDHRARIPLAAGVDSLNVATAAAIAFHLLS